jgi:hypothetical protein
MEQRRPRDRESPPVRQASRDESIESRESERNITTVTIVRPAVRRLILWLVLIGGGALLGSWPLWHVVRPDTSGCESGVPCDPVLVLPFAPLATVLTIVGGLGLLIAATLAVALFIRGVIRLDARERQARRQ